MLTKAYKDYIQSERWKIRCDSYWNAKGRWCKACMAKQRLVVHHLSYERFGYEPISDLIGLCHTCHLEVHRRHRRGGRRQDIRTITIDYVREVALLRLRRKTS